MRVKVQVTFVVEVDVDESLRDCVFFHIEGNGCPGTKEVGAAVDAMIEESKKYSTCWACGTAQGENKILEIDGKPV